jgi:hypothetical protein
MCLPRVTLFCVILLVVSASDFEAVKCPENLVCHGKSDSLCKRLASYAHVIIELNNYVETPRYYGFCIQVDQLSQVNVKGAHDYLRKNQNSTLRVIFEDNYSQPRYLFNENHVEVTVAFLTAVIRLQKGAIKTNSTKEITFDDSCVNQRCGFDSSIGCIRNQDCAVVDNPNFNNQTLGVFVAWEGEDSFENGFLSSGLIPSKFRAFSFSNYMDSILRVN